MNATVVDSVAANSSNNGFVASAGSGTATASLMLIRSVAIGNGVGIHTSGNNATLRVSQSRIIGNTLAWDESGGAVRSYGDNYVDLGNEAAPTIIPRK